MAPTFACGMPNPWAPVSPVIYHPPSCDHCFCLDDPNSPGDGPHLRCCKCCTSMAEKFVRAWFQILAAVPSRVEPADRNPT